MKIAAANGDGTAQAQAQMEWGELPRGYKRSSTLTQPELVALLTDRLRDYDANVIEVAVHDVADAVRGALQARGLPRMVVPPGVRREFLPTGMAFTVDSGLGPQELDGFGGVLTESTLAIAETGTIVLQNVPGQGRRAVSLLPDYHLCLVAAASVVETVPEAMARLQPTARLATTFISGPSATADIEMVRIKGVHGPRFLDVVLFG